MGQINDQVNIRNKKGINRQYSFALTSLIFFLKSILQEQTRNKKLYRPKDESNLFFLLFDRRNSCLIMKLNSIH